MGLIAGLIAKGFFLSLALMAICFIAAKAFRSESNLSMASYCILASLFILILWQGMLFFGGLKIRQYEKQLAKQGNAFIVSFNELPVPASILELVLPQEAQASGTYALNAVQRRTNIYIWQRVGWMACFLIGAFLLIMWIQSRFPKKKKKGSTGYRHYRSTDDF